MHEILHHTERMMPEEIRAAIYRAWSHDWQDAYKAATPAQKKLFADMLAASLGNRSAWDRVAKGFADGTLKYDEHYKLVNRPSTGQSRRLTCSSHASMRRAGSRAPSNGCPKCLRK
ncbi:MAG: hypothetical protein WDN30_14165 [Pararobbsia sp.]